MVFIIDVVKVCFMGGFWCVVCVFRFFCLLMVNGFVVFRFSVFLFIDMCLNFMVVFFFVFLVGRMFVLFFLFFLNFICVFEENFMGL